MISSSLIMLFLTYRIPLSSAFSALFLPPFCMGLWNLKCYSIPASQLYSRPHPRRSTLMLYVVRTFEQHLPQAKSTSSQSFDSSARNSTRQFTNKGMSHCTHLVRAYTCTLASLSPLTIYVVRPLKTVLMSMLLIAVE